MTVKRKATIALLVLVTAIILLIFMAVSPFFSKIKRESENVIAQKQEILESEARIKNIKDFNDNFKRYQPDLEKIDRLFVNISEPIEFIKFLESEAALSRLAIEINPPLLKEKDKDPWQWFNFELKLDGSFPDIARFIDRLESGPYLVRPLVVSAREGSADKDVIVALISIKVYVK